MNENWFMMTISKIKKVMSKQTEHDSRFDSLDTDLATFKAEILASIGNSGGGGIKKVQRGTATSAGIITIEEVVMEKTIVLSVSKGSAGTVAASGNLSMAAATVSGSIAQSIYQQSNGGLDVSGTYSYSMPTATLSGTVAAHTGTLSGGTTNLTVAEYSAVLTSSTTIKCDGACEWQVVEFY